MWKVAKVGEVSFDINCTPGGGGSRDNYKLNLNLDLDENRLRGLLKSGKVSAGSDIEFKALNDWGEIQELTEDGGLETRMKIQLGQKQGQLKVVFETKVEILGGGEAEVKKNFVCNNSGIKPVSRGWWHNGKNVFTSEMLPLGNRQLMSSGIRPISFSISLKSCEYNESGTVATCDLKINEIFLSLLTN